MSGVPNGRRDILDRMADEVFRQFTDDLGLQFRVKVLAKFAQGPWIGDQKKPIEGSFDRQPVEIFRASRPRRADPCPDWRNRCGALHLSRD